MSGVANSERVNIISQCSKRRGIFCKSALDLREGRLVRLFPDHLGEPVPLHAVMPSRRFLPQRVHALVEHLAARLAALELPD